VYRGGGGVVALKNLVYNFLLKCLRSNDVPFIGNTWSMAAARPNLFIYFLRRTIFNTFLGTRIYLEAV
jgi:hypothetical protein